MLEHPKAFSTHHGNNDSENLKDTWTISRNQIVS